MLIGLTGGAACGKSLVADEFKRLGAGVVDADVISREIYVKGTQAHEEIVRQFGQGVLRADGEVDRKALGKVVFADAGRRKALERITHPAIRERIREEAAKRQKTHGVVVVVAPLLFETGLDKEMDKTITVFASEAEMLKRLMKRDAIDETTAKRIISAQLPLDEKKKLADFVINNSGTVDEALEETRKLYRRLSKA